METAESLRRTIAVTEELQSVVKTMKALAGVNIRQYERAAHAVAEYNRTVEMGLQIALAPAARRTPLPPTRTRPEKSWAPSYSDRIRACADN